MKDVSATYLADELAEERVIAECYHIWSDYTEDEYYTSDNEDITAQTPGLEASIETHQRAVIERDTVEWSSDLEVTTMKLKVANVTEPIIQYIANNPVEMFWIEVYRVHKANPNEVPSIIFLGQIQKVVFNGTSAEVSLVGFENYLKRIIPTYRYQKTCNNSLYDDRCKVVKTSYDSTFTITDISASEVELTGTGMSPTTTNWWKYGYAEFDAPGTNGLRRAMISYSSSNYIKLSYKLYGLEVGNTITLYPGCNKFYNTCGSKFNNADNFGGMPYISHKNPTLL